MSTISWQDLRVSSEGEEMGTLGEMVRLAPANLDAVVMSDGEISDWPGFELADEQGVDWTGFEEALAAARG